MTSLEGKLSEIDRKIQAVVKAIAAEKAEEQEIYCKYAEAKMASELTCARQHSLERKMVKGRLKSSKKKEMRTFKENDI